MKKSLVAAIVTAAIAGGTRAGIGAVDAATTHQPRPVAQLRSGPTAILQTDADINETLSALADRRLPAASV